MKKNLSKSKKTSNKGITLIALVITIIVLLILAGVSIAILTGENGILTQAQTSKERTEKAEAIERAKLDIMAWRADKLSRGEDATITKEQIKTILTGKEYVKAEEGNPGAESFISKEGHTILYSELYTVKAPTGDTAVVGQIVTGKNKEYTTEDGTAKIPVGFMIVPGCDDISEGLVISDDPDDTEENPENIVAEGNQFVWIPVTSGDDYVRNTTYANTSVSAAAYTDTGYLPEGIQPTIEASITDVEQIGLINERAERDAVLSAGGFYIGRYEAGDSSTTEERSSATDGVLVSKKNVYAYSYITQEDAKAKAKTFTGENNQYVKSALISGIQWDVTMATINGKKDGNGNTYDVATAANDSNTSDRHVSKTTTGQNIADKVYNIYDLEGNFYEYVAEKNTYNPNLPCVGRGGYYSYGLFPASDRDDDFGDANSFSAFHLSLYVM